MSLRRAPPAGGRRAATARGGCRARAAVPASRGAAKARGWEALDVEAPVDLLQAPAALATVAAPEAPEAAAGRPVPVMDAGAMDNPLQAAMVQASLMQQARARHRSALAAARKKKKGKAPKAAKQKGSEGFGGAAKKAKATRADVPQLALPPSVVVEVVDTEEQVPAAMAALGESMGDAVVGFDLEWKPERKAGEKNPVALVQLATASRVVLLRTNKIGHRLPEAVRAFLRSEEVCLVGFDLFAMDHVKMAETFDFNLREVGGIDLKALGGDLGLGLGLGLAKLTEAVLKVKTPKSKKISTSNWESKELSADQRTYAALDAWVCGQLFRTVKHDPRFTGAK